MSRRRMYFTSEAAAITGLKVDSLRRRGSRGISLTPLQPSDPENPTDLWLFPADQIEDLAVERGRPVPPDGGHLIQFDSARFDVATTAPERDLIREDDDLREAELRATRDHALDMERRAHAAELAAAHTSVEATSRENRDLRAEVDRLNAALRAMTSPSRRDESAQS